MSPSHDDGETIEMTSRYSYDEVDFEGPNEAASRALLGSDSTEFDEFDVEHAVKQKRSTPVPMLQLLTLCAVRIVDPIRYIYLLHLLETVFGAEGELNSFSQLFPYVNEMMRDLHVTDNESRIGFYSGLVVSYHSLFPCQQSIFDFSHFSG